MSNSSMLVTLLAVVVLAPPVVAQGNTVAPDPLGRGTWVIDEDADRVALLRPGEDPISIEVGRWPEQLVVDSKGNVYVTCRQDNRVARIDTKFQVTAIPTGAEPSGLFLDEAGGRLWAGLVTERALALIDTRTLKTVRQRPVDFEPGPLQLMREGLAVLSRQGGQVLFSAPSLDEGEDWVVQLPASGTKRAWRGEAMVKVHEDLVVVHTEIDSGLGRTVVSSGTYGGGATFSPPVASAVTLIRDGMVRAQLSVPSLSQVTSVAVSGERVAFASRGNATVVVARFPRGVDVFLQPVTLFAGEGLSGVTFEGESRVLALASFDRRVLGLERVPRSAQGDTDTPAERTLATVTRSFRPGAPVRVGMTVTNDPQSETIAFASPVSGNERLAIADYENLPEHDVDPALELGRRLFFDTTDRRISAGLACASCHPDGRQDGVVWRLNGSRRQTMLLAGRLADTAPYNWKGTTHSLEANIAQTTQRLGGSGLPEAQQHALAKFLLKGLRPVTLPAVSNEAVVERGRRLFNDDAVGCASCHPGERGFTDGETHDVESVRLAEHGELVEHFARSARQTVASRAVGNTFGSGAVSALGGFGGVSGLGGLGLRGLGTGGGGLGGRLGLSGSAGGGLGTGGGGLGGRVGLSGSGTVNASGASSAGGGLGTGGGGLGGRVGLSGSGTVNASGASSAGGGLGTGGGGLGGRLGLSGSGTVNASAASSAGGRLGRVIAGGSRALRVGVRAQQPFPPLSPAAPVAAAEPPADPNDHAFDTPSLRNLAVSAPYMHDGAYPTLEQLLEQNHDRMGTTSELSPEDRAALAAYLRTL